MIEGTGTDANTGEARDYICAETSGKMYVEGRESFYPILIKVQVTVLQKQEDLIIKLP